MCQKRTQHSSTCAKTHTFLLLSPPTSNAHQVCFYLGNTPCLRPSPLPQLQLDNLTYLFCLCLLHTLPHSVTELVFLKNNSTFVTSAFRCPGFLVPVSASPSESTGCRFLGYGSLPDFSNPTRNLHHACLSICILHELLSLKPLFPTHSPLF